jgi:DNA (cytosine-5)-methyltransferase 1
MNNLCSESPKVLDCFCGAGGLSLGFEMAGFKTLFAFDNDPTAIETYKRNFSHKCSVEDITKISKKTIEEKLGSQISPDIITGGPPCQGFSVQRRGKDCDKRNNLVLEYLRIIFDFRPKFFVMENVGGLLAPRGREVMLEFTQSCEGIYWLHIAKLHALDFGVPQDRRRVFIVGELSDERPNPRFSFPKSIKSEKSLTVRDAIEDLMDKTELEIPNHRADKLSLLNFRRISFLKEGQSRDSLPLDLQLKCHKENKNHRHLDVYGRLWWDKPAPTITARFDSFSRGRFGHPVLNRTITLREGARLQSFPDSFIFTGSKVEAARQIGNAVPPKLAFAVASEIKKYL